MEASRTKARAIINPSSGGGTYDPDRLREDLSGFELDWVQTEGPEDAKEAAGELRDGLLIVVGGDGTINDVVNGLGNAGFPEGVTLAVQSQGSGIFDVAETGEQMQYTTKAEIDYKQAKQNVCAYWTGAAGGFAKGKYTAEVYQDGYKIGTKEFMLK